MPPADSPEGGRARLRVNLAQGEFEVEGSEAFVRDYAGRIEELLTRLGGAGTPPRHAPGPAEAAPTPAEPQPAADRAADDATPFGEVLVALPRTCTDVDRMLLAGLFLQRRSAERTFATSDANRLLLEHGVKLGNPSQSVKQNLVAKRAFAVQRGRYRVSQTGLSHLEQLCGRSFAGG